MVSTASVNNNNGNIIISLGIHPLRECTRSQHLFDLANKWFGLILLAPSSRDNVSCACWDFFLGLLLPGKWTCDPVVAESLALSRQTAYWSRAVLPLCPRERSGASPWVSGLYQNLPFQAPCSSPPILCVPSSFLLPNPALCWTQAEFLPGTGHSDQMERWWSAVQPGLS